MPSVVQFKAPETDQQAVIEILETALATAKAGSVRDVAVVMSINDDDGPQFATSYYGEGAYASLLAGVSALEFDMHYRRYVPED